MSDATNVASVTKNEYLDAIFKAKSVAVVGASDRAGSVGGTIFQNLQCFDGPVYPVNGRSPTVMGKPAFKSVVDIPGPAVDLIVVVVPAKAVPACIKEAAEHGVKGAIIISAGFKEVGPEGVELEREIMRVKGQMRIVGPNVLGVMNPLMNLNASFAACMAPKGSLAFFSQSGALCTSVLDWSLKNGAGFSAFVSVGSMLDVNWGDLISYFGFDDATKAIIMYCEGMGEVPEAFFNAARQVSLNKPIIIIKSGRTAAGAAAASSHTGSLTGSDDVLNALCERCGVLRVDTIEDLFLCADVLCKQPLPPTNKMQVVTNAGGPGVICTDALIQGGGELCKLDEPTRKELDAFLPAAWSHANPLDILGDAPAENYARTLAIAAKQADAGGVLVILTPQSVTDSTGTAKAVVEYAKSCKVPIFASWMGGVEVAEGIEILTKANIPCFSYPDTACRIFNYLWRYSENLQRLYDVTDPSLVCLDYMPQARDQALKLLAPAIAAKRTYLTEAESKELLRVYGIPTCKTIVAETAELAAEIAEKEVGFPVVVKLHSETITHKSDVGGVFINMKTKQDVINAFNDMQARIAPKDFLGVTVQDMASFKNSYEVILGMNADPQYGPVMVFGAGGTLVEVFRDSALCLPPINKHLAKMLVDRTKISKALNGFRGVPASDLDGLYDLLVKFSTLLAEMPEIAELDINPLLARPAANGGCIALDARVILDTRAFEGPEAVASIPRALIQTYPGYLTKQVGEYVVRAATPADAKPLSAFAAELATSDAEFQRAIGGISDAKLAAGVNAMARLDYATEMAMVAVDAAGKIVGVARLAKSTNFSVYVAPAARKAGVAAALLGAIVEFAKKRGYFLEGSLEKNNAAGIKLVTKLGFHVAEAGEKVHLTLQC